MARCADPLKQWTSQTDPFTNDNTPLASPGLGILSPGIGTVIGDDGDEVISTAVVVKNIPFSLKKETLLDLFVCVLLQLPFFASRLTISSRIR